MVGYTLLSITSKPVFKKKKVSAQNQFIGLSLINITFNINIYFMTAKFNTYKYVYCHCCQSQTIVHLLLYTVKQLFFFITLAQY